MTYIVERELEAHIEEQKADFMASGMTESEAEAAAVAEMGDPVEVGVDMDRIHRPKMNWPAMAVIAFLSLLGLGIRYYLDLHVVTEYGIEIGSFGEEIARILAGLGVMAGICLLDYTRIAYRARELMVVYFVLLVAGKISSIPINGSKAFIPLYFLQVSVNVRMALILFIPLYCAVLYRYRGKGYGGLLKGILWSAPMLLLSLWYSVSALDVLVPTVLIVLSAAVLITGAIILLFIRLASRTWRQANRLGMLMGIGCGTALLTEIVWYVLTNMGIIIPGSVYCPFITYGNSGAVVTYVLLGIMLSIYRYQNGVSEMYPEKTTLFGRKRCQE